MLPTLHKDTDLGLGPVREPTMEVATEVPKHVVRLGWIASVKSAPIYTATSGSG